MIKIENTQVFGWEAAIRGMRNPMNSWEKSDSGRHDPFDELGMKSVAVVDWNTPKYGNPLLIGPNDANLMMRLVKAGDEHAKFMRMIHVQMDILAPLYWWKQADTYKVGFVTNSCSTMHTIHKKEFNFSDFSFENLINVDYDLEYDKCVITSEPDENGQGPAYYFDPSLLLEVIIDMLNQARALYLQTEDKTYWWQMIQLLPDSYNQLRTCDTNYATLRKMYHQRKGHKLDEWHEFCDWIRELPYSELITG